MITLFCVHPKGFNVGNEAIHVALRGLVYEAFGRVVNIISVPAVSHYESHAKAGLTAKSIYDINRFGDGVIVGGGNLYENGELAVDGKALTTLEPPLMLFSLSRGRVYNRNLELVNRTDVMADATLVALHKKASFSLTRDQVTLAHLQEIGCHNAVLGGCPTIFLDRFAPQIPSLPDAEVPGVLITVRNPSLMNLPLRLQARVQQDIEQVIDYLRSQNVGRIRILCHDVRDVEFATVFQASRGVDYVYTGDVYWYLSLLRSAKLVISYRLHAVLPCFSFGTPAIKVSYDERAVDLMKLVGLGDWNINMAEEKDVVGAIIARYQRLGELPALRSKLESSWEAMRTLQLEKMGAFAESVKAYARAAHAALPPRGPA